MQPPVGFWDPLGLSASGNLSDFKRRREVELKHGASEKRPAGSLWVGHDQKVRDTWGNP